MRASTLLILLFPSLAAVLLACGGLSEAEQHYNAGVKLQEQGQLNEAITEYDKAIQLDPKMVQVYNNRGNAYLDLGQPQRAIPDYDEAIRLNPNYAAAYSNRGFAYINQGQHQRAIQDYNEAIRLDPNHTNAYAGRALTYTLLRKDQEAEQDVAKAVELGLGVAKLKTAIEEFKEATLASAYPGLLGFYLPINLGRRFSRKAR